MYYSVVAVVLWLQYVKQFEEQLAYRTVQSNRITEKVKAQQITLATPQDGHLQRHCDEVRDLEPCSRRGGGPG